MLQSVNDLKGYIIVATDGEIGNIEEFYFDDTNYVIRYLVANTGSWLSGKQNLISPFIITHLDKEKRKIHVALTKGQVLDSPGIDKHQPVSRQMEKIVSDYYGASYYWDVRPDLNPAQLAIANAATATVKSAMTTESVISTETQPDVHLRSVQEVATYEISALDGPIGRVEDFILETDDWEIHYLTINTGNWLPGKHVLVSAGWVSEINWSHRKVSINLTREQIEKSPNYDKVTQISREYQTRLHNHYNQKILD
jgi:hypothetical protein